METVSIEEVKNLSKRDELQPYGDLLGIEWNGNAPSYKKQIVERLEEMKAEQAKPAEAPLPNQVDEDTEKEPEAHTEPSVASQGTLEPVQIAKKGRYSVCLSEDCYQIRKEDAVIGCEETEEDAIRKMENFARFK